MWYNPALLAQLGELYPDRDHPDQPGVAKDKWPPCGSTPEARGAPPTLAHPPTPGTGGVVHAHRMGNPHWNDHHRDSLSCDMGNQPARRRSMGDLWWQPARAKMPLPEQNRWQVNRGNRLLRQEKILICLTNIVSGSKSAVVSKVAGLLYGL